MNYTKVIDILNEIRSSKKIYVKIGGLRIKIKKIENILFYHLYPENFSDRKTKSILLKNQTCDPFYMMAGAIISQKDFEKIKQLKEFSNVKKIEMYNFLMLYIQCDICFNNTRMKGQLFRMLFKDKELDIGFNPSLIKEKK